VLGAPTWRLSRAAAAKRGLPPALGGAGNGLAAAGVDALVDGVGIVDGYQQRV
jgi:hypothetical protein